MKKNPLYTIQDFDQSIWQDDIGRKMILSGELKRLIEQDGIRGVTSNPSIFEKAIAESHDYDEDIRALALQGQSAEKIYQALTVKDVQMAADLFRPLFDRSNGRHGFVSLEVNPHLARDVDGTIAEACRLWKALDRPNVMIKVPATEQGLICIRQLISEGLNINVTLLFGLPRYREVADAYIGGLEARAAAHKPLDPIASVASFFLSRIDVWIDPMLKKIMEQQPDAGTAKRIYGQVAIASAKGAYRIYKEIFEGDRFGKLTPKGARPQRVLWASTGTKEPEFSDIKYVEALIGPDTVNTLPRETLDAYRDHGRPARRLDQDMEKAGEVLESLFKLGIDLDQVTQGLEEQGIEKFVKPYDSLLEKLEKSLVHPSGR
jgi:transaldolase